jgi:hypothetical protein
MQTSAINGTGNRKTIVVWIALVVLLVLLAFRFDSEAFAERLGLGDFIAYWSAGRQLASGENPYDWRALLALQQPLGWSEDFPNMMYYPPWALPFVLPFGALPFGVARLAWFVGNVVAVIGCAELIWRYYGGSGTTRWIAWGIALSFVPTLIALKMGQISPLLLLGIIGFLHLEKRGLDFLAGAVLLLPAIKPQLVYLFGLAVLIWAIDRRRWRILIGGVTALASAMVLALLFDPRVLDEYRYALANPPSGNITPTLGAMLRLAFGENMTWLQYVPTVAGVIWFGFFWATRRDDWNWSAAAPVLVLMSFLTTAYGAWVFDLVVLLLPVLQLAVWAINDRNLGRTALLLFSLINGACLAMNLAEASYPAFIWVTPAMLACYLGLSRMRGGLAHA